MRTYRQRAEERFAQGVSSADARSAVGQDPEFFDIATPPNEQEIDLHFPDVPRSESFRTAAGSLARLAGGAAATGGMEIATAGAMAAPMIARTIHSAGPHAVNLLTGAARLTRDYGPTVAAGTAAGAGMMIRGMATGGQIAAGTISAAAELAQALAPASHRGRDYMGSNGIRFAPSLARLMSEHGHL